MLTITHSLTRSNFLSTFSAQKSKERCLLSFKPRSPVSISKVSPFLCSHLQVQRQIYTRHDLADRFSKRHMGHGHGHHHDHGTIVHPGGLREGHKLTTGNPQEEKAATRITVIGLITNVAMSIGKLVAGILGNSSAMIADAAHSISDLISDFVTLFAVKVARKPKTALFPFGFGKFESVGALSVAAILIATGFGTAHHAFEHISDPSAPTNLATFAAFASIIGKDILYRVTAKIAEKQHSQLLMANAWHHRSDAISSVVALVGIVGSQMGLTMLDPLAGIAVAGFIVKVGVQTGWESLKELSDAAVEQDTEHAAIEILKTVKGINHVTQLRTRKMGPYIMMDISISMNPDKTIKESDEIIKEAKEKILESMPRINEVLIAVEADVHTHEERMK